MVREPQQNAIASENVRALCERNVIMSLEFWMERGEEKEEERKRRRRRRRKEGKKEREEEEEKKKKK